MPRGSICVTRNGKLHRIAWFNESKTGIYYGVLGSDRDHHLSYHQDGRRHNKAGDETYGESADTPLHSHAGVRQLSSGTVWLTAAWLNPRTKYDAARESGIAIIVPQSATDGGEFYLAVDWCLVELAATKERHEMRGHLAALRPTGTVLEYREVPLDHFPGRAIAIAVSISPRQADGTA